MNDKSDQEIIYSSGVLVIPSFMPECFRILETISIPTLHRYLLKKEGIVIQGLTQNTIEYSYLCPIDNIEESKKLKCEIHFARFIENKNPNAYSKIKFRADLDWKEFSLIDSRHIRFQQIICVNSIFTLKA
ncbi:hypothetical protein [Desulfitobacterium metallireducens]|uniref:Uncharacterized protein n=1 Tax=Desulfitobacterium metallireducens DSM 15288 TaxID=871968 RepID=W0EFZ9_9FIRM|nr:hypothetical protein [Desulfitobacterium metallireducens]AHF08448.1 hypothetical protein DESME_03030 [Desulfitobacterium metallireducens DSM 15288]